MKYENTGQMNFLSEMSERQISAQEFFCNSLLDSLDKNFGLKKVLVLYFDTQGKFLSWKDRKGILISSDTHPYNKFMTNDVIRHVVYQDAVRDQLTYFDVAPRLYKSTDMIKADDYEHSAYVRFLEDNFKSHYSVSMAFGINAYIQLVFVKNIEEGDFTNTEMEALQNIYGYVANAYKNFKKHEQAKIVSNIQSQIISSGEKAYLVTDKLTHVMSYNQTALNYLEDILGPFITEQIVEGKPCSWLSFLLEEDRNKLETGHVQTRMVKDYVFKIYTYNQSYSNGIIDRYHWITISAREESKILKSSDVKLTQTEQKVAELMYNGLSYKAIATELMVSYHTVKKHVQNIYIKCGVKSRYELHNWMEHTKL